MDFKDHFSGHAAAYARHRPGYAESLFDWLAENASGRELAWDAGTGNGQAARGLAARFTTVHATDASDRQLAAADGPGNVRFAREPAEHCSLEAGSVDLVTVGQALHWFEVGGFYAEVNRVLRPGGLLAAWTYQLNQVDDDVDRVVGEFFGAVVGPYWPPERVHVERGYLDLPFPFADIDTPDFSITRRMNLEAYLGYIGTWSAVRRFIDDRGTDPLATLRRRLEPAWGDPSSERRVHWPLALRAGRKPRGETGQA